MWSTAVPSLRGRRNRNSCQYLLDQAVAQLISNRYYMWLLTRPIAANNVTTLDLLEIVLWLLWWLHGNRAGPLRKCRV